MRFQILLILLFSFNFSFASQLCSTAVEPSQVNAANYQASLEARRKQIVILLQNIEDPEVLRIKAQREEDAVPAYRDPYVSRFRYEISKHEILLMEMALISPDYILPSHFSATEVAPFGYATVRRFLLAQNQFDYLRRTPPISTRNANHVRQDFRRQLKQIEDSIDTITWIEGYWINFTDHQIRWWYNNQGRRESEAWVKDITIHQFIENFWSEISQRLAELKRNMNQAERAIYSSEIEKLLSYNTYAARTLMARNTYREFFRGTIFQGLDKLSKQKPGESDIED